MSPRSLSVLAPAKINLDLHVTGRRGDGYHLLDSIVAFADVGDLVTISPAARFMFSVQGPFASAFTARERDAGADSGNLAVRAAHNLAAALGRPLDLHLMLTKNLPLASGLGGGSADAAAVLWALLEWWGVAPQAVPGLPDIMVRLGADVPVCFACRPVHMTGIGEKIAPLDFSSEVPVVLVNPGKFCSTKDVFARFDLPFAAAQVVPDGQDLMDFVRGRDNMLTGAACAIAPEIGDVLSVLADAPGCALSRMSGSGATCFGLFTDAIAAQQAAETILMDHPRWWVRTGMLNRPERY